MKRLAVAVGCMFVGNLSFGGLHDYILPYQSPLDSMMKGAEQYNRLQQQNYENAQRKAELEQLNAIRAQQNAVQKELTNIDFSILKSVNESNYCETMQSVATSIMKARQIGKQPSELASQLSNLEIFSVLIQMAYEIPVQNDVLTKLQVAKEYGNKQYFICKSATK